MVTGFSPRKRELALYLGETIRSSPLMAKLGKHTTGHGCLYLKRLDDVDRGVLKTLIEDSGAAIRGQNSKGHRSR
jgi:hypothetical protein